MAVSRASRYFANFEVWPVGLLVGLFGALVGGFVMGCLLQGIGGFWGSIFVSFLGAGEFVAIRLALSGRQIV